MGKLQAASVRWLCEWEDGAAHGFKHERDERLARAGSVGFGQRCVVVGLTFFVWWSRPEAMRGRASTSRAGAYATAFRICRFRRRRGCANTNSIQHGRQPLPRGRTHPLSPAVRIRRVCPTQSHFLPPPVRNVTNRAKKKRTGLHAAWRTVPLIPLTTWQRDCPFATFVLTVRSLRAPAR